MSNLDIKVTPIWYVNYPPLAFEVEVCTADMQYRTLPGITQTFGCGIGPLDTSGLGALGFFYFPDFQSAINFFYADYGPTLIGNINSIYGTSYGMGNLVYVDQPISDLVATKQDTNNNLTAFSAVTLATDKMYYAAGPTTIGSVSTTSYGRGLVNLANQAALQTAVGGITRITSSFSLGVVGTGATGTQVSSTKDSTVHVTYSTQFTYSLSGNPASLVTLKKCATNSATESDWTSFGRTGFSQQAGLAVTVGQQIQQIGQICGDVPASWYVKAVNTGAGTHTEAFIEGEKTIYG